MQSFENNTNTILDDNWTEHQELIAFFCSRNNYHKNDIDIIRLLAYQNNLDIQEFKNKCYKYDFLCGEDGDDKASQLTIKTFVKYHDISNKKLIQILTNKKQYQNIISDIEELKKYDFNIAEFIECKINKSNYLFNNIHQIQNLIYTQINNVTKIINSSVIKTYPDKTNDKQYIFIKKLNLSVEKTDNNKTIHEIIQQSISNKIKINIKVKINNQHLILKF